MFDNTNDYYRQVQLLVRVIPFIAKHSNLALKGGTAINLFIRELPRLSVDIDLVYLPFHEREQALSDIAMTLGNIADDIERAGVGRVQRQTEAGKLFIESNGVRVKIEVNTMLRGHILQPAWMGVCQAVEDSVGFAEMSVINVKEIYAGKLCAALDRQHPRDLFDVKVLLENEGIDQETMNVFLVYLMSSSRPIAELLSPNLKNIQETFTAHFDGMTVEPVSCAALEAARVQMIEKMQSMLTAEHKKFLLDFKSGNENWDDFVYSDAREMPSIKWKQMQLANMTKQKRLQAVAKLESVLNGAGQA